MSLHDVDLAESARMHGGGRILKADLHVSELRINAGKLGDTILTE